MLTYNSAFNLSTQIAPIMTSLHKHFQHSAHLHHLMRPYYRAAGYANAISNSHVLLVDSLLVEEPAGSLPVAITIGVVLEKGDSSFVLVCLEPFGLVVVI